MPIPSPVQLDANALQTYRETLRGMSIERSAEVLASLGPDALESLRYAWPFLARPSQLPPVGRWRTWLILAGRGFGKTRCGAEWVRSQIESGKVSRMAIVAPTGADAREVIVEGESGIMAISPPQWRPYYEPSKRRLTWPNGAIARLFSAEEPHRLRGDNFDAAWCDELAVWPYPDEAWANLWLALRKGLDPRVVVTTTPMPIDLVKKLVADARSPNPTVSITTGSTFDNQANLAPSTLELLRRKYEGTTIGRQELYAEVLEDVAGSLWTPELIDRCRVEETPVLRKIVIGVDPAVVAKAKSAHDGEVAAGAETGIVTVGLGVDGHAYVIGDVSGRMRVQAWADAVAREYARVDADAVVAEINNGGDLVVANLERARMPRTLPDGTEVGQTRMHIRTVHAAKNKRARAEPVAALYEQGRVHHLGVLKNLETQMTQWSPESVSWSPDRVDALVWAVTELMLGVKPAKWSGSLDDFARRR